MKSGNKMITVMALLILVLTASIGCAKEEETPYNRNMVVELQALPFHMSSFQYNNEVSGHIELKLHKIFGTSLGMQLSQEEYLIVNHDGEDLTEEFKGENMPSSEEIAEMAIKIKESGYLVVNVDRYRVTTIEKEIKALFAGERRIHPAEKLQQVLDVNIESYENEDYEAINLYLLRNRIIVSSTVEEN